jgi:hypothetical protein
MGDRRGFSLTLLLILVMASPLRAQPGATLQGRALDASGAVIPGAAITMHSPSMGFDRSVRTDDQGRYHIAAIPPGSYEVTASMAGFKSAVVQALIVEVGRTVECDFYLEVGDASETVVVTSERPLIDRAAPTFGHVVTEQAIQEGGVRHQHGRQSRGGRWFRHQRRDGEQPDVRRDPVRAARGQRS